MGWIRTYDQNINYKQKQRWSKAGTLKKSGSLQSCVTESFYGGLLTKFNKEDT